MSAPSCLLCLRDTANGLAARTMAGLIVASQLNDDYSEALQARLPELDIVRIPRGVPATMPAGTRVMIAAPFAPAGRSQDTQVPPGWPFGLQWIQLVSTGADPYPAWVFQGPAVTSARGASSLALAEFALAAIFSAAKRMPETWIHDAKDWAYRWLDTVEGATLGLVGFGGFAQALAPKALALGMRVLAVRKSATPPEVPGVETVGDLAELLSRSDHCVLAAPANAETKDLIGDAVLARAKPGLHLVNLSRGALIDETALLRALATGRVGLATLDVASVEPLPADHVFYTHPRIRLSPHTSVMTRRTLADFADLFADNLQRFLAGESLRNLVDPLARY